MPDQSLRCLAVRVLRSVDGKNDNIELEAFLNKVAGQQKWISTTEWLFVEPPAEASVAVTLPVVMTERVAIQAVLADLIHPEPRILADYKLSSLESRKWRWVAFQINPNEQGLGYFPWERNSHA